MRLLVDSVPKADPARRWQGEIELPAEEVLRTAASTGCRVYPRCGERMPRCREALPPLFPVDGLDAGRAEEFADGSVRELADRDEHVASCYLYEEGAAGTSQRDAAAKAVDSR